MQLPLLVRIALPVIAFFSIFWLPWPVSLIALFLAGLVYPPAALAIGVLTDLIYYPGHGLLRGTIDGFMIAVLTAAVRHFVKTRIM